LFAQKPENLKNCIRKESVHRGEPKCSRVGGEAKEYLQKRFWTLVHPWCFIIHGTYESSDVSALLSIDGILQNVNGDI
jgi:hypothetical protein